MKCAKDGKSVGLLTSGKYLGFDATGEKIAWKLLLKSNQDEMPPVIVQGVLRDSIIAVSSIKFAN
jgi:hypothetical protein